MKVWLMIIAMSCVGCVTKVNDNSDSPQHNANNENNENANNRNNENNANNLPGGGRLNALSSSEAESLCSKYLDEDGWLECDSDAIEFVPPAECSDWFSGGCATVEDFEQCLSEICTVFESAACAAALDGECVSNPNNINNQNNVNPSDGQRGDSCQHPEVSGSKSNSYASLIGNTAGCEFKLSDDEHLACLYDTGSGSGRCEYTCDASEVGTNGDCPDGLTCTESNLAALSGNPWYTCE